MGLRASEACVWASPPAMRIYASTHKCVHRACEASVGLCRSTPSLCWVCHMYAWFHWIPPQVWREDGADHGGRRPDCCRSDRAPSTRPSRPDPSPAPAVCACVHLYACMYACIHTHMHGGSEGRTRDAEEGENAIEQDPQRQRHQQPGAHTGIHTSKAVDLSRRRLRCMRAPEDRNESNSAGATACCPDRSSSVSAARVPHALAPSRASSVVSVSMSWLCTRSTRSEPSDVRSKGMCSMSRVSPLYCIRVSSSVCTALRNPAWPCSCGSFAHSVAWTPAPESWQSRPPSGVCGATGEPSPCPHPAEPSA